MRVLIVEDEPALRMLLAVTLTDEGYDVCTAEDGRRAIELVEAVQPDAVILDLEMPVMDGRACFRELRSRGFQTPVLILSGSGAVAAAGELGAQAALSKPFDPDALIHHLSSAVA